MPVDLFAASDGNVYGLTELGGDFGNGTIFAIDPGGSFRHLLSIPINAGGSMTSLVRGIDGRFYVTAQDDGFAPGTVFMIDDAGTVTNIHTFTGAPGDGDDPIGLMQRSDGRLYGTTRSGGEFSAGTVYAINLDGTYRIVHSFRAGVDGSGPGPDLLEASDGNLYGVTSSTLFRIDSSETLTTLHNLSGLSPGELIQGLDGRLYGPTAAGGLDGGGTIIVRDTTGTLTTLHEFSIGESPGRPNGVIQGRDGVFYGTTRLPSGTPRQTGTVFAMDTAGARTTLHTFMDDGSPIGHLFEGADGSLYGTTFAPNRPFAPPSLQGQIFTISPGGLFTRLASAGTLRAGVIQARDTRLYGVTGDTSFGVTGVTTVGSVFRVEADGTLTELHAFGTESAYPVGELVEIDDYSLYGATEGGPVYSPVTGQVIARPRATVFQIDPTTRAFATRYRFPDGTKPAGRLIQGTDGLLYGTTVNGGDFGLGTVFSLDAAGTLTTLHHFSGGADGSNPNAGVIQGTDGRLHGATTNGGAFGYGTVFAMNVTGGLTTLHNFALSDGAKPVDGLIQANDGTFYGAASAGGPNDGGVIFRVRLETFPSDQYFELVSRNSGKCLDVWGASTDAAASVIQWVCHGGENQQWRLEPASGGAFRIIARHSGQALDVFGALLDDVTPIIQWPVHGGDNQVWTLEPASDGYVSIVARHSGKALDVEYAATDDGARVIQYTPHGGGNQQWLLRAVASTAGAATERADEVSR
jgi:uncharacterized repeat protein (TIGR03803 family)